MMPASMTYMTLAQMVIEYGNQKKLWELRNPAIKFEGQKIHIEKEEL